MQEDDAAADVEELRADREEIFRALKSDVNAFLWVRLPSSLTLGEAEQLACEIHDRIMATWGDTL